MALSLNCCFAHCVSIHCSNILQSMSSSLKQFQGHLHFTAVKLRRRKERKAIMSFNEGLVFLYFCLQGPRLLSKPGDSLLFFETGIAAVQGSQHSVVWNLAPSAGKFQSTAQEASVLQCVKK